MGCCPHVTHRLLLSIPHLPFSKSLYFMSALKRFIFLLVGWQLAVAGVHVLLMIALFLANTTYLWTKQCVKELFGIFLMLTIHHVNRFYCVVANTAKLVSS